MNKNVKGIDGRDLANELIGKKILKVEESKCSDGYNLYCNNGLVLKVVKNEGCGGCENGWSAIDLMALNDNDNIITDAEYILKCDNETFTIFIYYDDGKINKICGSE